MNADDAVSRFNRQIEASHQLKKLPRFSPEFKKWRRDTEVLIEKAFPAKKCHTEDFKKINYQLGAFSDSTPDSAFEKRFHDGLTEARLILQSFIDEIKEYGDEDGVATETVTALEIVRRICVRMPIAIQQLKRRHEQRPTLVVNDEYDLQDFLHAALCLHFDDIRPEEPAPSRAGASTRLDFVLKQEQIVVETKKTRKGLGAKEVGEQILVDINRYQAHPDCKTLVCLVYDPDGLVRNPRGLEADLTNKHNEFEVIVFVVG